MINPNNKEINNPNLISGIIAKEMKEAFKQQPNPIPNQSKPIVDSVIEELLKRKQLGIERYGVALQAGNGRDAIRDALDEAIDLVFYLYQAIAERDQNK